ncbi:MAG TPA: hypothetical protein VFV34_01705 [Blastocatellia bacterium]|nr:hypothetical protein [Blastocatellia bacterium]
MRRSILLLTLASCLLASAAIQAAAQEPGPPKVVAIFIEEIKPGRGAAHERVEAGYVQAFKEAKMSPYVAMTSLTGRSEAWFVVRYDSFEAWEQENQKIEKNARLAGALARLDEQDAAFRTNQRTIVARYREDLSYNPMVNLGEMRYFQVITFRVRPGHTRSFEEARKMSKGFHEKAKVDEHYAVFQVESGMPGGTFMLFLPRKSLKEIDNDPHTKTYQDIVGDSGRKQLDEMASADVLSTDSVIFAFSPRMSYPSEALLKADPSYWKPKPLPMPAPAKKPEPAKTPPGN